GAGRRPGDRRRGRRAGALPDPGVAPAADQRLPASALVDDGHRHGADGAVRATADHEADTAGAGWHADGPIAAQPDLTGDVDGGVGHLSEAQLAQVVRAPGRIRAGLNGRPQRARLARVEADSDGRPWLAHDRVRSGRFERPDVAATVAVAVAVARARLP